MLKKSKPSTNNAEALVGNCFSYSYNQSLCQLKRKNSSETVSTATCIFSQARPCEAHNTLTCWACIYKLTTRYFPVKLWVFTLWQHNNLNLWTLCCFHLESHENIHFSFSKHWKLQLSCMRSDLSCPGWSHRPMILQRCQNGFTFSCSACNTLACVFSFVVCSEWFLCSINKLLCSTYL